MLSTWAKVKKCLDVASRRLGIGEPPAPQALVLIEDDFDLDAVEAAIRQASWEPTFAGSHGHAVQLSGDVEFDLLLVDIASPSMGLDMIREFVTHPCFQSLPVVALLDDFDPDLEQCVCEEGCVGHLHRPLHARALGVALRDFSQTVPPYLAQAYTV